MTDHESGARSVSGADLAGLRCKPTASWTASCCPVLSCRADSFAVQW